MHFKKSSSFKLFALGCLFVTSWTATAKDAYQIGKKKVPLKEVFAEKQSTFYDLELKKYNLVSQAAREAYLNYFWKQLADKKKLSVQEARDQYISQRVKIDEQEVSDFLKKLKDHPQLSKLSVAEQRAQVEQYLLGGRTQKIVSDIIDVAIKGGELKIFYQKPSEPVFDLAITKDDIPKYRGSGDYSAPDGCVGAACPITVIEYSEFQCPYCRKVLPDVAKLFKNYKGKIRWVVRDFPLGFHQRARPAAIAARCAGKQGKYWQMYHTLFENQRNLEDKDFEKYAKEIGINVNKFTSCVKNPGEIAMVVDRNSKSGSRYGVSGTPAFFINGKKLTGAVPYGEFARKFDEVLAKKTKSKKKT